MAILSFDMEEGEIEHYNDDASMLRYRLLFGEARGWLHCERALQFVRRIREVRSEEAAQLWAFLERGGSVWDFERRMAPEDWVRLLQGRQAEFGAA
jgi:hypothetical protein